MLSIIREVIFMDFNLYVSRIKKKSVKFLLLAITSLVMLGIAGEILIAKRIESLYFFLLFTCIVTYLIVFYKKEFSHEINLKMKPFEIKMDSTINYADIHNVLVKNCENNKCFDYSEKSAFFTLKKKYNVRVLLYSTEDFNKKEYEEEKKKINRKANKLYSINQWVTIHTARKHMRVNLIHTECVNDNLFNYISGDAEIWLTRVEGIMNIVVSNDRFVVPPLKPTISIYAIDRYKDMVKMLLEMLGQ